MTGLTNGYLNDIGKQILGDIFLGSFPCDITPNVKNKINFCLIFNLSKHDEEGTHFIAIFADKERLLYFDPLGDRLKNKHIKLFLKNNQNNRKITTKFPKIQSDKSIFCGYYCLSFLLAMSKNISTKAFFDFFNPHNLIENDYNVIKFIQQNI